MSESKKPGPNDTNYGVIVEAAAAERGLGGPRPSDTLWWTIGYLLQQSQLHTLRSLHSRLIESGTTSRVVGMVEEEISRKLGWMAGADDDMGGVRMTDYQRPVIDNPGS